jgi:iron(III) transport system permease protein
MHGVGKTAGPGLVANPTALLRRAGRLSSWDTTASLACAVVLAPILALLFIALQPGAGASIFATSRTMLAGALLDTLLLLAGVLVLSLTIGLLAGWVVSTYEFPGRRWLSWALVLPFAIPTYISAYCYVEALDFFGPMQTTLRTLLGYRLKTEYWFPDVRSMPGAVIVTALVLYPYIYVASRAAFAAHGVQLTDAARSLGCNRGEAVWRVVLPAIWPMLVAAGTLVILETLNDIGASQHLGVQTLTISIFNTWLNRNDLGGAAQLSLLLLVIVTALLWIEHSMRNNKRFTLPARGQRPHQRIRLHGAKAWFAAALTAVPVAAGFGLPVFILAQAAMRQLKMDGIEAELLKALGNSLLVAGAATAIVLFLALLLATAQRFSRSGLATGSNRISMLGYALPGTVLVIGLLPLLGFFDTRINQMTDAMGMARPGLLLSGTVFAVVAALVIRFLAIGLDQTQSGLGAFSRNMDYAARTLGCQERRIAARILYPAMRPALAGAAILVFVDSLKELPATLLLRPLNFETLATLLYGHASRGSFEDGAIAALLIVIAGLLPLVLLSRFLEPSDQNHTANPL